MPDVIPASLNFPFLQDLQKSLLPSKLFNGFKQQFFKASFSSGVGGRVDLTQASLPGPNQLVSTQPKSSSSPSSSKSLLCLLWTLRFSCICEL